MRILGCTYSDGGGTVVLGDPVNTKPSPIDPELVTAVEAVLVQMAEPVTPQSEIEPGSFFVAGNTMFIARHALPGLFRLLSARFSAAEVLAALDTLDRQCRISPSHVGSRKPPTASQKQTAAPIARPWYY